MPSLSEILYKARHFIAGVPRPAEVIAKAKRVLLDAILTDKVLPFVWVYYLALLIWGIYGTWFAGPATYVAPVMGQGVYDGWVWMHIIGTLTVMFGLQLETRSREHRDAEQRERVRKAAIAMQAGGHMSMFLVLFSYEISAIAAIPWGAGAYSIFVIAPYVLGCVLLFAQCVARLVLGDRS